MARRSEATPVYEAVQTWVDHGLLRRVSIFGYEPLWTPENFARLNADFIESPLEDARSFLEKLQEQLASSPSPVKLLVAEMLWVMMLFPSNVSYEAKVRLIAAPYEWLEMRLPWNSPLIRVLSAGVGSTGQAYNQHRWRELTLFVRAMIAWGEIPHLEHVSLLRDGWAFAAWLDRTPDAKNRQFRNILLHLLFPDLFERISSFAHKRLIVRHFGRAMGIPLPRESTSLPVDAFDRPLAEIRKRLEAESPGRTIDFYDPDLEGQWRPSRRKPVGPKGDPTALERRLDDGLREVVAVHAKLADAVPALQRQPTLGLLAAALLRSLSEDNRDTARALWQQINRPALPLDPTSVLLLFKLPYDEVPESVYRVAGDVDVDALLASRAGEPVRVVLERADECAREVSGKDAPLISGRHLIAAILRPGPMNEAKRALRDRGHRLDRLRAALMDFFQARLVDDVHDAWREYLDISEPPPVLAEPGFARDYIDPEEKTVTPDYLGVDPDVQALARLLCARSVDPPLSVGLFADWGTGKSTFMQRLKRNIGELSRRAESAERRNVDTAYQGGVVPIWFNAWHYMDANLWASLVTHIFESLAKHLSGNSEEALEQVRRSLYGNLAASQRLLKEAEGREALATAEVDAAKQRADDARAREAGVVHRIARARDVAAGLWKAIAAEAALAEAAYASPPGYGSPPADAAEVQAEMAADEALAALAGDMRAAVDAAATELGLREGQATVGEIRGTLAQMRGLWGSISASAEVLHRRRGLAGDVVLALLAVLVIAATVLPLALFFDWRDVRAWVVAAGGFLVSLVPVLSVLGVVAARVRRVLERADAEIRAGAGRAAAEADALQRELDRVKQAGAAAERDRIAAQQKVDEIRAEIEDIRAGRRLEHFIRDRAGSDDYRRHLGIIATIRRDFEALETLLADVRREAASPPGRGIDGGSSSAVASTPAIRRIVLYIDDLDRCPEERVVEVLQAVHLLLAFPLFVVVVGVDSRWLLRAVQSQYERLLASERDTAQAGVPTDDSAHWSSTPQNYLEKIFQIPFTLEPMDAPGFERLLGSLLRVRAPAADPTRPTDAKPADSLPAGGGEVAGGAGGSQGAEDEEMAPSDLDAQWLDEESEGSEEEGLAGEDEDAGLNPPGLEVEAWELAYLGGLSPLIGSPRMAKRFANVYRFIRAALSGPALERFSGTAAQPGEFRAVGLLLALLTGYPGEAVELFRRLLADAPAAGEGWPEFARRVVTEAAEPGGSPPSSGLPARRWGRLLEALEQVEGSVGMAPEMEPYRRWAPRVARFSFTTGQILARRAPQPAPA